MTYEVDLGGLKNTDTTCWDMRLGLLQSPLPKMNWWNRELGPNSLKHISAEETHYEIVATCSSSSVYLGTIGHPEWVFFRKVPRKVLLSMHVHTSNMIHWCWWQ